MALLTVENVSKEGKDEFAVKNISFSQQRLEKIAIAGETGSGKTTLLKMIGGLVQPDSGIIRFENKKIIGPQDQLIPGHPGIAYLSQHFELRNNYWVYEILEYANKLTAEEAQTLYAVCRIDHLLNRRTDQLSGGEKQRIALARLLTGSPKLLLLDEPFSNLDAVHKNIIKTVIEDIGSRLQITCMMVSHDAPDILSWANKILVIKDGELLQTDTPENTYNTPVNAYCAGLFGTFNLINKPLKVALAEDLQMPINEKQMLVRPEHFKLAATGHHALEGTVKNIVFFGNYYTADVFVQQQLVKVNAVQKQFVPGDKVYLVLSSGNESYF